MRRTSVSRYASPVLILTVVVLILAPLVMAATDPRYTALEQRVTALEARVAALEPKATPTPIPTPTPTPTPAPTPTATPTPAGRPFPAPVTSRTVAVPLSIDRTGATDVSAAINAFIASVPDGSVISFPTNATYRLGGRGILFGTNATTARHNLIFEGNGATLRSTTPTDADSRGSTFALWGTEGAADNNSDIIIRNFHIVGTNTTTGHSGATNESRRGILLYDGNRIEITNVTTLNTWSDAIEVAGANNVWVHDNTFTHSGRMGVSVTQGQYVLFEDNTFDLITWCTLDVEPNTIDQEVGWITFRNNTILRGGTNGPEFVSGRGGVNTPNTHDITITGNRTNQTLRTDIDHISRRRNVVFTNNIAAGPAAAVNLAHIDGLTYYGNVGASYVLSDNTNVDTTP